MGKTFRLDEVFLHLTGKVKGFVFRMDDASFNKEFRRTKRIVICGYVINTKSKRQEPFNVESNGIYKRQISHALNLEKIMFLFGFHNLFHHLKHTGNRQF